MAEELRCRDCGKIYPENTAPTPRCCECGAALGNESPEESIDVSPWLVSSPAAATPVSPGSLIRNGLLYGHWQTNLQVPTRRWETWLGGLAWGFVALLAFRLTAVVTLESSDFGTLLSSGPPQLALTGVLLLLGTAIAGTALAAAHRLGLKPVASLASMAGLIIGLVFVNTSLMAGLPWLIGLLGLPPLLAWLGLCLGAMGTPNAPARTWRNRQCLALGLTAIVLLIVYAAAPVAVPAALLKAVPEHSPLSPILTVLNQLRLSTPAERQVLILQSSDPRQSRAAAEALIKLHDPGVVASLAPLLEDDRQEVREMAAYALGGIAEPAAAEALARALVALQTPRKSGQPPQTRNLPRCFWAAAPGSLQRGLELARSQNPTEVQVGIMLVGAGAKNSDLPELQRLLAGPDSEQQAAACTALGCLSSPAAFEALLQATRHPNIKVRHNAMLLLVRSKDPRALPALLAAASQTGGFATQILTTDLLEKRDPRIIPLLLKQVADDPHASTRQYIEQLAQMGPAAIPPLAAAASSRNPQVRKIVLGVLRASNDPRAVAAVKVCEAQVDDAWRRMELEELRYKTDQAALAEAKFREALRVGGPDLRAWAEKEFEDFCNRNHKDALGRALEDPAKPVRIAALRIIGRQWGHSYEAAIRRLLKDPDAEIRAAAVPGIKSFLQLQARRALYPQLLKDPSPAVRQATAEVLAESYDSAAAALLLKAYQQEKTPPVRAALLTALGKYQMSAPEKVLLGAAHDASPLVREAAVNALRRSDSSAARKLAAEQRAAELQRVKQQLGQ